MNGKKYRLIFHGIRCNEEGFKRRMSQLAVPAETVEAIIRRAPVAIKQDITLKEARQYADAVQLAGGRVTIQECGYFEDSRRMNPSVSIRSLENFTMCPECGFKQPKGGICRKCGFPLEESMKPREGEHVGDH